MTRCGRREGSVGGNDAGDDHDEDYSGDVSVELWLNVGWNMHELRRNLLNSSQHPAIMQPECRCGVVVLVCQSWYWIIFTSIIYLICQSINQQVCIYTYWMVASGSGSGGNGGCGDGGCGDGGGDAGDHDDDDHDGYDDDDDGDDDDDASHFYTAHPPKRSRVFHMSSADNPKKLHAIASPNARV